MKEKGIGEIISAAKDLIEEGHCLFLEIVCPFEDDYTEILAKYEREGWLKKWVSGKCKAIYKAVELLCSLKLSRGMANTNLEFAFSGRLFITSDIPAAEKL